MTPEPPTLGPGPYPQLMWVQQFPPPPLLTTPPPPEQCYGCQCLFVNTEKFIDGGNIANEYTCVGGKATHKVPSISWTGAPGQGKLGKDGKACPVCNRYALTVEDLDYPDGVGETSNNVRIIFWAANIPSDWTEINDENAFKKDETGRPIVVVGTNPTGVQGFEVPCPSKGTHRYRTTLWAMDRPVGDNLDPLTSIQDAGKVLGRIKERELARAAFFANVKSEGYHQNTVAGKKLRYLARLGDARLR